MSSGSSSPRAELADALRRVLLDPHEAQQIRVQGGTEAAVLVPIFLHGGEPHLVFTKRRDDLRRHAGEISFPGGRADETDRDLAHTALREACEEIGLAPEGVEILGALQPTPTIATGYAVYPFVGLIDPGLEWTISPREVDRVLEFSVRDLRAGYARERILRRGVRFRTDVYVVEDSLIWGATARILGDLLDRLDATSAEFSASS